MKIKNLKVITANLCLVATLLAGCGDDEIKFGNSTINYESEVPSGKIKYEDLDKYARIVLLENDLVKDYRLMMKYITKGGGGRTPTYDIVEYIDLESGATLIKYYDLEETDWVVGENFTFEEIVFSSYLLKEDFIKKDYTVEEVLTFFEEKIKPALENNEKELIK